jgi:predicted N-acetyltransferase YhbS
MTTDVSIAGPFLVAGIAALINQAYEVERFFVEGPRTSDAEIASLMEMGAFLVAHDDTGKIVGSVYAESRAGGRGYIGLLAVDPSAQGGGLGSRLMETAEQHLRERGSRDVDISVVNIRLELPPFYERRGYRADGTLPFTDTRATRECHFIVMTKSLAG